MIAARAPANEKGDGDGRGAHQPRSGSRTRMVVRSSPSDRVLEAQLHSLGTRVRLAPHLHPSCRNLNATTESRPIHRLRAQADNITARVE